MERRVGQGDGGGVSAGPETDSAFPSEPRTSPEKFEPGMTLLEWYVGQALAGGCVELAGGRLTNLEIEEVVGNALAIATHAVAEVRG